MTKNALAENNAPTMIIPSGTEIEVDVHGQLSIRTPGNLVIQNSGNYASLESVEGSIRIEPDVQVEAVNIRCAETCYVQGNLTAWRVTAKAIQLEDTARAHIILQESERLEVGREARLVGNFSSEKELFLLFSRFAKQFRSIPFYFERTEPMTEDGDGGPVEIDSKAASALPRPSVETADESGDGGEGHDEERELPAPLLFASVLLDRAVRVKDPTSKRVLDELIKLLKEQDLEALRHTHKTLFGRISKPSQDVNKAQQLIREFYES